jgi:hypothetical protein
VNGTARIQSNLTVTTTNATGDFATIDGSNIIRRRTAAEVLGDIGAQALLTNPITGTGTANFVPKFTGSTTIGNSQIFDNGTNVGIGTTTPTQKLDVQGNITITKTLLSNQENLDVDSGATRVIATIASATYDAAFFDFVIKKGTNLRAGTVYSTHDGTNVVFTETSTNDIGNTNDVTLTVDISGGNIRLLATTLTNDWIIKTLVRGI